MLPAHGGLGIHAQAAVLKGLFRPSNGLWGYSGLVTDLWAWLPRAFAAVHGGWRATPPGVPGLGGFPQGATLSGPSMNKKGKRDFDPGEPKQREDISVAACGITAALSPRLMAHTAPGSFALAFFTRLREAGGLPRID